ncbi:hypothetical protein HYT26_04970 [Candidatus Pacearchaeota archaeon]|nr:hypothetical protein [Candidatus Pacearchaeota archaeon]
MGFVVSANVRGEPARVQQREGRTVFTSRGEAEQFQRDLRQGGFDRVDILDVGASTDEEYYAEKVTAPASTPDRGSRPIPSSRESTQFKRQEEAKQRLANVEKAIKERPQIAGIRETLSQQILSQASGDFGTRQREAERIQSLEAQGITFKAPQEQFIRQGFSEISPAREIFLKQEAAERERTRIKEPPKEPTLKSVAFGTTPIKEQVKEGAKLGAKVVVGTSVAPYLFFKEEVLKPATEPIFKSAIKGLKKAGDIAYSESLLPGFAAKQSQLVPSDKGLALPLSDKVSKEIVSPDKQQDAASRFYEGSDSFRVQIPTEISKKAEPFIKFPKQIAATGVGLGAGFLRFGATAAKDIVQNPIESYVLFKGTSLFFKGASTILPKAGLQLKGIESVGTIGVLGGGFIGIETYQAPAGEKLRTAIEATGGLAVLGTGIKGARLGVKAYKSSVIEKPSMEFDIGITTGTGEIGARGKIPKPFAETILSKEQFAAKSPKAEIEFYDLRAIQKEQKPIRDIFVESKPDVEIVPKQREIPFEKKLLLESRQQPFFEAEEAGRFIRVEKGKVTRGFAFDEPLFDLRQIGFEPKLTYQPRTYFLELEIDGRKALFVKKGSQLLKVEKFIESKPLEAAKEKPKAKQFKSSEKEFDLGKGQVLLQELEPQKAEVKQQQISKQKLMTEQIMGSKLTSNLFPTLSKLASRQKQKPLQKSILGLTLEQEQRQRPKQAQRASQILDQKQSQGLIFGTALKPRQKQKQEQLVGLIPLQKPKQDLIQMPKLKPRQKQDVMAIPIIGVPLIQENILDFPPFIPPKIPPRSPPQKPPKKEPPIEPPKTPPTFYFPKSEFRQRKLSKKETRKGKREFFGTPSLSVVGLGKLAAGTKLTKKQLKGEEFISPFQIRKV